LEHGSHTVGRTLCGLRPRQGDQVGGDPEGNARITAGGASQTAAASCRARLTFNY